MMTVKHIFLVFFAFKVTHSQYYGLPGPSYQPNNYWCSSSAPLPSQQLAPAQNPPASMYPSATAYPQSIYAPTYSQLLYPTSTFALPPLVPPNYTLPPSLYPATPTYPPVSTIPEPQRLPVSKYNAAKYAPVGGAPKCNPSTATAYYLTTAPKASAPKVKEINKEVLPPPTHPCPFCTGFADVPKNSKIEPPPPCGSVLPSLLDKISTITFPDELNIKNLKNITPPSPPLFSDLLEKKLAKKLRFDQDVLDGFLTGLGLGK